MGLDREWWSISQVRALLQRLICGATVARRLKSRTQKPFGVPPYRINREAMIIHMILSEGKTAEEIGRIIGESDSGSIADIERMIIEQRPKKRGNDNAA